MTAERIDMTEELGSHLEKFNIFKDSSKPVRLSLHLIVKRNLPPEAEKWSQEEIVNALNEITHLRLDRENIYEIDSLELLGDKVKNVYLQQNSIQQIQNLECLKCIKFLSLAGNCIKVVENLLGLNHLRVLDLSDNQIQILHIEELPNSLIILNLENNPCTEKTGYSQYREKVIQHLPELLQLDGEDVRRPEDDEDEETIESDDEKPASFISLQSDDSEDIPSLTSAMLMRSQDRLESCQRRHKRHTAELEEFRLKHKILIKK
ncbi:hypothetical protein SNE40_023084 [Patella caerulea]|uniref:Leucine-rich repeat-containing protein 46 n=1 Tax=Patella caerulea TaxID=87958 RepID=A0AAN8FXP0_PATCE